MVIRIMVTNGSISEILGYFNSIDVDDDVVSSDGVIILRYSKDDRMWKDTNGILWACWSVDIV